MIGAKDVLFPALAALCGAAFFYRVRGARFRQRDPALLALLVAFAVKAVAFLLATPRMAAAVDRHLGIPDLSALGIHLLGGVAFGAAVVVVLVYWAHDPDEARRRARWALGAAAAVTVTMFALWVAAGLGTRQRSTSYLVQNAHRPLVVMYLSLYVTSLLVALGEIARLCLKYAGSAGDPWLRRGLRITGIGALIYSVNFWNRAFTIVAVQLGLDPLEWEIVVLLGLGIGMPLVIIGLTMPSWGPYLSDLCRWWHDYSVYSRLYPLWRDLCGVTPGIALHPSTRGLTHLNYRLYRRVIEIRDGLLALRSYRDPDVRCRALQRGQVAGLTGDELRVFVAAAQLKAALHAKAEGRVPPGGSNGWSDDSEPFELRRSDDLAGEAAWLGQIARAYVRSPVG